ncbi:MobF family relaxase [Amycolatopsis sp. NPDC047767]|uniref:MobF family relaxase n=1 Tax=Amycolatopsis sp. NPDC047767 TaxID=3156765 RepID=UPI003452861B
MRNLRRGRRPAAHPPARTDRRVAPSAQKAPLVSDQRRFCCARRHAATTCRPWDAGASGAGTHGRRAAGKRRRLVTFVWPAGPDPRTPPRPTADATTPRTHPHPADHITAPTHSPLRGGPKPFRTSCRSSEPGGRLAFPGVAWASVMGLRKLSPGGHEYLTNAVACHDRRLEPGELLSDYYLSHGYPAGEWFGAGAQELGLAGQVSAAQMQALFGEGRHPNADAMETELIAGGATADQALKATQLGRNFPVYSGLDGLRSKTSQAYKQYNREHERPVGAPIDAETRRQIRRSVQEQAFRDATGASGDVDATELNAWLTSEQKKLKQAVSGFEMVFAPDKSVSVAWALAQPAERELIANLVRQAARDTLTYVEHNLAFTRAGNRGEAQVDVDGITVATFEHWDSRSGDPHVHIHALISAKVRRSEDGKWTALDGRPMLAGAVTASEFFDSRTRDLFRAHGAKWSQRPANGVDQTRKIWQLAAVPLPLIKGFSQRTRQFEAARARRIVDFRDRHGREPRPKEIFEIDRAAKLDGRPGKQPPQSLDEHTTDWVTFARTLVPGAVVEKLGGLVFSGPMREENVRDIAGLATATLAAVSEKYAHFTRWHLESEAHRQTSHLKVSPQRRQELVAKVVEAVMSARGTVTLEGATLVAEAPFLRRRSGESVFQNHNSTRYTTTRTLFQEGDLVAWARRRGGHVLLRRRVDRALKRSSLNEGQQRMVRQFARSGRRLQLALAPAGAGKTAAMKLLTELWTEDGGRVYAFGPSARAAQEIGTSIDATPHTLHQLPTAIEHGFAEKMFPLGPGDLLIVDEAAMAGTHTLHAAVTYALKRGADVRLIGDDRQLAAVEAGGAVRLISLDVGAVRFSEVVRFKGKDAQQQAAASLLIRDGVPAGLTYYDEAGVIEGGSIETMRAAALFGWRHDLRVGKQSLLIVPTNEDTVALNLEARAQRLKRQTRPLGIEVDLHDGSQASAGDLIVTRRNRRRLKFFRGADFVKNGDTWRVVDVDEGGSLTVQHVDHGARVTLPRGYVRAYVELAYATTVNRVQGMTSSGNSHTVVPQTMTREQLYPAITRAMRSNFMYVVTHLHLVDQHQESVVIEDTETDDGRIIPGYIKVLKWVLKHSGIEPSATEVLRESLESVVSMATLVERYNYATHYLDEDTYLGALARHAPEALGQKAEPALVQTLRNASDAGWHAEHLLATVTTSPPLTETDDAAAVLITRLNNHLSSRPTPVVTGHPDAADVTRWRTILDAIAPDAAVEDEVWHRVWKVAAGALARGHDVEAAMTVVAHQLSTQHTAGSSADPTPDHLLAEQLFSRELAKQAERGQVHVPAVAWQARPDLADARRHPGRVEYLSEVNEAIGNRVEELRAEAIRTVPRWTHGLGPRPADPLAAWDWDDLVGLATAYRETYRIKEDDPAQPLGDAPTSRGVRAQAWAELARRWSGTGDPPRTPPPQTPETSAETFVVHGEAFTMDDVLDQLDADTEDQAPRDTLDLLVARYNQLAHDGDESRYLDLLARYVSGTVNTAGEPRLVRVLADAQDTGWQPERVLHAVTRGNDFSWAEAPDAALLATLHRYLSSRQPPARTATPSDTDLVTWREVVGRRFPDADVETDTWDIVWRHAAGAALSGVDVGEALGAAAAAVAQEEAPPERLPVALAHELVGELTHRTRIEDHNRPAVPWLAQADPASSAAANVHRLRRINEEIADRVSELRTEVLARPPHWAPNVGARSNEPAASVVRDETIAQMAAYRESFRIRSADPDHPLGSEPYGNGPRAREWHRLDALWSSPASPNDAPLVPANSHSDTFDGRLDAEFDSAAAAHHLGRDEVHRRSSQVAPTDSSGVVVRQSSDSQADEPPSQGFAAEDFDTTREHRGFGY